MISMASNHRRAKFGLKGRVVSGGVDHALIDALRAAAK
jgi:hypothetical protein